MTTATLTKENISLCGFTVSEVQSLVIMVGYCSIQADVVLERQLRVLHIVQATGSGLSHWCGFSIYETSKPYTTVTHFFQQGHSYSNKTHLLIVTLPQSLWEP